MWPDAVLFNLIKNLPEKTLRKLSQGFVRRFPGGPPLVSCSLDSSITHGACYPLHKGGWQLGTPLL